jgi:predicted transcriptional regulator
MEVVTTQLPDDLASSLVELAELEGRSKSWLIREALSDYLSHRKEQEAMTLEGLQDLRAGRVSSHSQAEALLANWGKGE